MIPTRAILLVEDNEDDVFFLKRALKQARLAPPVWVAEDGQQAINYLAGRGEFADRSLFPLPTLVLLDLQLPLKSGFDVLEWIRSTPPFEGLEVVILTSSNQPSDMIRARNTGADCYLVKPPTPGQLLRVLEHSCRECGLAEPCCARGPALPPTPARPELGSMGIETDPSVSGRIRLE